MNPWRGEEIVYTLGYLCICGECVRGPNLLFFDRIVGKFKRTVGLEGGSISSTDWAWCLLSANDLKDMAKNSMSMFGGGLQVKKHLYRHSQRQWICCPKKKIDRLVEKALKSVSKWFFCLIGFLVADQYWQYQKRGRKTSTWQFNTCNVMIWLNIYIYIGIIESCLKLSHKTCCNILPVRPHYISTLPHIMS